jgi:hypothetical protein
MLPMMLVMKPLMNSQERDELERQVEELRSVCNIKVRAAEAKWEDAMVTIERITARAITVSHVSFACQTDDTSAPRVHAIASQTSNEGARLGNQVCVFMYLLLLFRMLYVMCA